MYQDIISIESRRIAITHYYIENIVEMIASFRDNSKRFIIFGSGVSDEIIILYSGFYNKFTLAKRNV